MPSGRFTNNKFSECQYLTYGISATSMRSGIILLLN